jgi:hypothetical protein
MNAFRTLSGQRIIVIVTATLIFSLYPGLASASVFRSINIDASGGQLTGTLMWTGLRSFELQNMALADTTCDRQPVFFFVSYNGHDGPLHYNNNGCATTTSFATLEGADAAEIDAVTIKVCRGLPILQCDKLIYTSL